MFTTMECLPVRSKQLVSGLLLLLTCSTNHAFPTHRSAQRRPTQAQTQTWIGSYSDSLGVLKASLADGANDGTFDSNNTSSEYFHTLDNIQRVFCLSDLHTDHVGNMQWLRDRMARSDCDFTERDLMIVAGDISHEYSTLAESIAILKESGCQVLFLPGNHEAWLTKQDKGRQRSSLQKLERIYETCRQLGVLTEAIYLEGTNPLWILPLECWYDGSLSFSEDLCRGFKNWPWVDFAKCAWPVDRFPPAPKESINAKIPTGLVEYFLKRNRNYLKHLNLQADPSAGVMTVSHFLPNQQSLPDWLDLEAPDFLDTWLSHGAGGTSAKFAKVAGSALLDAQIRSLLPAIDEQQQPQQKQQRQIHIFGHSHRPKDFEYKGIRYIHNPLGKPRERERHMVAPKVDFQLVWETARGEVAGETVIRYWDEKGGGVAAFLERMEKERPGRYSNRDRI
jgi:hypothetical protein